MLYNSNVTDNIYLNLLRIFFNTSNLESDNTIIGFIKAIKYKNDEIQRSLIKFKVK